MKNQTVVYVLSSDLINSYNDFKTDGFFDDEKIKASPKVEKLTLAEFTQRFNTQQIDSYGLIAFKEAEPDVFGNLWSRQDVEEYAKNNMDADLTDTQIDEVIETAITNFDAIYGINWDSIEDAINEVIGDPEN